MSRTRAVTLWREICGSDAAMAMLPPTGRMLEEFAARLLPPGWQAIPTTPTPAMMEAFAGAPLEDLAPVKAAREYLAFARMLEVAPKA